MKQKFLKFLLGVVSLLSCQAHLQGQATPCGPCGPCMVVNVDNRTGCDLTFTWGYFNSNNSCTQDVVAGIAHTGINNCTLACPFIGPCMRFCNDYCACPIKINLVEVSGTSYFPWGDFSTWTPGGSTYIGVPNICPGCPNGLVDIIVSSSGGTANIVVKCN